MPIQQSTFGTCNQEICSKCVMLSYQYEPNVHDGKEQPGKTVHGKRKTDQGSGLNIMKTLNTIILIIFLYLFLIEFKCIDTKLKWFYKTDIKNYSLKKPHKQTKKTFTGRGSKLNTVSVTSTRNDVDMWRVRTGSELQKVGKRLCNVICVVFFSALKSKRRSGNISSYRLSSVTVSRGSSANPVCLCSFKNVRHLFFCLTSTFTAVSPCPCLCVRSCSLSVAVYTADVSDPKVKVQHCWCHLMSTIRAQ